MAFHSAWVEPVLEALAAAAPVGAAAPARRWVSTVTGAVVTRCPAGYWRDQARAPVRFAAAVETLRQQYAGAVFLEVGPGRTLTAVGTETARGGERWVAPLRRGREWRATLEALAVLYVAGVEVAWAAYDAPYARRRVAVPTYPFQRQRYWFDAGRPDPASDTWRLATAAGRQQAQARSAEITQLASRQVTLNALCRGHMRKALEELGVLREPQQLHEVTESWRHRAAVCAVGGPVAADVGGGRRAAV